MQGSADACAAPEGFEPPTAEEVAAYFGANCLNGDPQAFFDFYASQGWRKSNGMPISDWQPQARAVAPPPARARRRGPQPRQAHRLGGRGRDVQADQDARGGAGRAGVPVGVRASGHRPGQGRDPAGNDRGQGGVRAVPGRAEAAGRTCRVRGEAAMTVDAGVLRGWSKERAELYGKPHLGARYAHGAAYEPTQPRCAVCGRRASNCHHVARRSWGKTFRLVTPNGCGSCAARCSPCAAPARPGATGKFHDGGLQRRVGMAHRGGRGGMVVRHAAQGVPAGTAPTSTSSATGW